MPRIRLCSLHHRHRGSGYNGGGASSAASYKPLPRSAACPKRWSRPPWRHTGRCVGRKSHLVMLRPQRAYQGWTHAVDCGGEFWLRGRRAPPAFSPRHRRQRNQQGAACVWASTADASTAHVWLWLGGGRRTARLPSWWLSLAKTQLCSSPSSAEATQSTPRAWTRYGLCAHAV